MSLFTDDFLRANNTALGANWTEAQGDSSINTNALRMAVGAGQPALAYTTTTAHASIANVKVTVTQNSASGDGGPVARATTGGALPRGYAVDVFTASADIHRFENISSVFSTVLLQHNVITQVANGVIALQVQGTGATVSLTAWYNGVQLTGATDSSATTATAGRIVAAAPTGVHNWTSVAASVNLDYDNFVVDSTPSIESNTSGNWATSGTWVGGVVPGDGDTAIIMNGHTVTIADGTSVTVGNSISPGVPAIQTAVATGGTGILIVGIGSTLTVKANLLQGNATWQFNAGSTLNFLHATANLTWQIADGGAQTAAKVIFNGGTGADRITVQSTGAANCGTIGMQATGWSPSGQIDATGVQFTSLGTATIPMMLLQSTSTGIHRWTDCLFTSCGKITTNNAFPVGTTFSMTRCTSRTPLSTDFHIIDIGLATGVHTGIALTRCRWEGTFYMFCTLPCSGVRWTDCVGSSYLNTTGWPLDCTATVPHSAVVDGLLLYNKITATGSPSLIMNGTLNNICSIRGSSSGNKHAMTISVMADTVIDSGAWEFIDNDEDGDELQVVVNPATVKILTVQRIIVPPSPDGTTGAGTFVNITHSGASSNNRIFVKHNTVAVSAVGATPAGSTTTENTTGGAGVFQGIHSNLWWRNTNAAGWGVYQVNGVLAQDTFMGADYNNRWNLTTDGYNPLDTTFGSPDTPGGHDKLVDPLFIDPARRFLSYGQSIIQSITTAQQVFDEFLKQNDDAGSNQTFSIDGYIRYMRAGFMPRNRQLLTAGQDNSTIGAVQMTDPVIGDMAVQQRMR